MLRVTMNNINKEASKFDLELVKGKGYFYWDGNDTWLLQSTSVMVYKLTDLTFKQWMEDLYYINGLLVEARRSTNLEY